MTKIKLHSTSVLNLIDLLRNRAEAKPSARAYTWLIDGEREGASLTRAALEERARTIGIKLNCLTPKPESALLIFPPGLPFIETLFGCWYAGIIAVPAYVPHSNHDVLRIEGMLRDSGCTIALTLREIAPYVQEAISAINPEIEILAIEELEERETRYGVNLQPQCREIAYLQYTSGSTASPKGVIVTHSNVLENLKYIESQGGFTETSLSVNWLPHFHDMGLIYGILQPLFTGFPSVSFSPSAFTHKPLRWLSAITRYRGTHCGGPNFAYDLCVERVTREECASLNLSCWQVAFNGAEPIRKETLKRFANYFSSAGFQSQAFYPVYGLAEATLKVTSGAPGAGPKYCSVDSVEIGKHKVRVVDPEFTSASTIVGCGRWDASHEVAIVNPETKEVCSADEVGEIWVSGPSVTAGYWRNKAATQQAFGAFLRSGKGPFLRTGDLGFYRDELFITGRLKDCIIVRGRNHYPQDIEESVEESHPALRRNGSAAFCVERDGRERVVVVCQVKRQFKGSLDEIVEIIRKAIAQNHELQAFAIVLVKTGGLPKTSSGKVQRQLCKALFSENKLPVLLQSILDDSSEAENEEAHIQRDSLLAMDMDNRRAALRTYIRHAVARVLRRSFPHTNGNCALTSLGFDSLMLAELKHAVEAKLAISLSLERLFGADMDGIVEDILGQIETASYSTDGTGSLERLNDRKYAPASYSQEQIWLIQELFPETSAYNLPTALCLRGELNAAVLKRSLDAIWGRHEGLRSVFVMEGELRVELLPVEPGMPLEEHDLRGVVDADERLQRLMVEEAKVGFDLAKGPMIRARLVRLDEEKHVLLLTQHHIVSDGWSMGILARELGALYGAFSRGEENPLPPLTIQYPDYAAWQREWLSGERLQKQSEYWRETLADAPALLELPTDRPRPEQQSFTGGYVPVVIERELAKELKELSRRQGTTLFMTLLGAWTAVLSRLSGQREVVIGTPVANRRRAEAEGLIGFFVNTLALRIDLSGEPSVAELLKRVSGVVLKAQEHQDVPFEQVVEILQPPRQLNHTPVFQVMFSWQNKEWGLPQLPGVKVERLRMPYEAAKFDLQLDLVEEGNRIVGGLSYAAALFDQGTIERQAGYLLAMLKAIVTEQTQAVYEIDLLSAEERRLLLETWNATEVEYPKHLCIHQLFEEQVRRSPEAIALVYEEQRLSYEELNQQANQLAHHLIGLGVKPDDRVAICVERGVGMVVGLLAILKAGGAYVPLDPAYPCQRLREILEDARPHLLLSDAAGREALGEDALKNVEVIDVGEPGRRAGQQPAWAEQPRSNPDARTLGLTSRHLAYVIYTSGSTGKPKGVAIEHRNAGNLLCWGWRSFAAEETQHTLFCTSLQFDLSIYECLVPLIGGGTVHVVKDALALIHRGEPVSLVNTVPSAIATVLEHGALPTSACTVNLAGEPLKAGLIRRLLKQSQVRRVCNLYGPTETTTYSTWISMERGGEISESIGRPIANTKIYLLDEKRRPVPLGAVGEIYIGGAGVARGYLNRPELTEERFVRDGFSDAGDGRMYRTGDLGRYLADGRIEFLGRNDQQVKIRGFRIELGEIEARLAEHEWVRETVVVAREDGGGEKRLVAYVVKAKVEQGGTGDGKAERGELEARELSATLRAHLAGVLPEYMVPAAFVALPKLPLTPNGKLDRKALPVPEGDAYVQHRYEEPEGEIEEQLAGMWQELLGVERVGRQDDFFEMGGHSLQAMRLVGRVRQVLGVECGMRVVFARPRLAQMAAALAEAVREAEGEGKQQEGLPALEPILRLGAMPLSFAQQRLWFLAQMEGVSVTYHIPAVLRLRGKLEMEALKRSLDAIWRRHEGLRSVFVVEEEGEPRVELLAEERGMGLEEHDLRGAVDAEARLKEWMIREGQAAFDLSRGPLVRAQVVRVEEEEHVLLLTQHHIVSDGWSIGILARELGILYGAFSRGEENPLPPLTIQYPDYAAWQREWLSGERLQKQSEYWREALADAPALLELPTDRPRPEQQSFAGGGVPIAMDRDLTRKLKELSRRNGTTLYMTLLGAWAAVLSRLSGQREVVIGTPVANRRRAETEGLIGFFVNTLALRVDLSGEPSVAELLKRVSGVVLEAQEHQDVPFEQVVEMVQPPRRMSHTPVFQVMFSWQSKEWGLPRLPGVKVEREESDYQAIKFDVELDLREENDGIVGRLRYATALFEQATIERQAGYLLAMLKGMVAEQKQEVYEIDLLSAEERRLLLESWNATEAEYPKHLCIHQLFEEQVRRSPEAIAVVYEEQRLSYEELNQQANQLAHHLIGLGVKPDDRVAICVERGVGMVVGLLAILKAGGAYVPLDPGYPDKRLAYMLEDTQTGIVLTQAKLEEKLTGLLPVATRLIALDRQWDEISESVAELKTQNVELRQEVKPHHLAYVIYTSGSTGLSKGVMVEHQSVVNLFFALKNIVYSADNANGFRVSMNGPLTFDTSVKQVIQLLAGHALDIVPESVRHDTEALLRFIHERKIQIFDCTPSQLRLLLEAGLAREKSNGLKWGESLRCVLVGGEPIDESMWTMLAESGIRFCNVYGPTECTVDATIGVVGRKDEAPHIGRPIANTKIYLLDEKRRPVPLGAVGEIYIGGAGVARGYLNRPELTEEQFVQDPFTNAADGRMYRTGDLGRYLPDGRIEFLGRNDQQVKIRGFRIELGEIEARLVEHEWVQEAVVVARDDEKREKLLVAYVVPVREKGREGEEEERQGGEIDRGKLAGVLRTYLGERLPEYMVPAAFVQLEKLPLTPHGKLDRKALPAPEGEAYAQRVYEPPRGEIEESLANLWQELLGIERVGRQDHFFELGGHSLLAVRLQAHMWKVFGVELPINVLFARPTLEKLAEAVREAGAEGKQALPPIAPISRLGAMPLSFAQQRLWFLAQMEGVSVTYHIPAALRLRGKLEMEALKRSLDAIWRRHEGLRSVFVVEEGEPRVELLAEERGMGLEEHDLRGAVDAEAKLKEWMIREGQAAFDLSRGPLIRAQVVRVEEEEHVLLLTQHHIVSDGWSIGILARELGILYGAFSRGEENPLPPLTIQYPDYAAWQREWLSGERLQKQSEYWREALEDAPALLELPTDRPRPEQQSFAGGGVPIAMDRDLARKLKELSRRQGTTLFMTLLSGWAAVLSRLSGQREVVIGTPVANRRRAETEGLIGFFVNTLALRIDLSGEPSVAELLKRVSGVVLEAQEHQDVPFEQVVEMVQPPRRMSHTPVFQVMFSWQSKEWGLPRLPGVKVKREESDYQAIKFDVELDLREESDRIVGRVRYATALFEQATIERQAGYLLAMLKGMVTEQKQEVYEIDLLSAEERRLLLEEWNATEVEYPKQLCIHQLFEEQVRRNPEAIAVVYEEQRLSYEELNQQANQLAHHLISLGVKPDDRVAICVERGVGMVVGLLAILKAGGAYVPLDPGYPSERLEQILEDAGPGILLCDAAGWEALREATLAEILVVDLDALPQTEGWVEQSEDNPDAKRLGVSSHHLAYVIYTSGSTGKPKGAMNEHQALINRLLWMQQAYALDSTDVVLQKTSFSFDVSVWEFFWTLLQGAVLAVPPAGAHKDAFRMIELICKWKVTTVHFVPSMLGIFVNTAGVEGCTSLRRVICSGEALSAAHAQMWQQRLPNAQLHNLYGPTEAAIDVTAWPCPSGFTGSIVPIGRPIANTQIYLLDRKGQPVPLGAVGEIYIGGVGVARGYLNRAELTAERFVPDRFSSVAGARVYRTGDLARYLPDGNIEFLGRNDHQVKIRGFRIELGEIEARLAEHELVREIVVLAREDGGGEKRLVAYVVADKEMDAGELVATLRGHLAGILPEYMVPAAFVRLEELPLTPNGKLDRKALLALEDEGYVHQAYEAPQGEMEQTLADVWRDLLGVERVGRHDHFFELGGHSLLALRLVSRVRSSLNVRIELSAVFNYPRLSSFAKKVLIKSIEQEFDSSEFQDLIAAEDGKL
jgi:amino acid adenylation domain-containing protein